MSVKKTQVVVIGAGPGGYTAAFRAADLGKKVMLINQYDVLGGVCLNVGCIPSKTLLHASEVINESQAMQLHGVDFGKPKIDLKKLIAHKNQVVSKLTGGLSALAKARKVEVVVGFAKFSASNQVMVEKNGKSITIEFENCIIATGSSVTKIPSFPMDHPSLIDSTDALEIKSIPKEMLIIGGGIIGLEMATVYQALGAKISIVELSEQLIPAADSDMVKPFGKIISKRYKAIYLNTKVSKISEVKSSEKLKVYFEGKNAPEHAMFDQVLLAVGRVPNGHLLNAEKAGVNVDERGFISVDAQQCTNVKHIYAIGDVVGQPMLAHKAVHEGKVAAEVICGQKSYFDPMTIPSVAYTDPEIAWAGLTEKEIKSKNIPYEKGVFPWAASGRSLSIGREEGVTKLLFHEKTKRLIGGGIVGTHAGELIAEIVLGIEMGSTIEDLCLSIHAHPTLSETIALSAEMAHGSITDLIAPKRK